MSNCIAAPRPLLQSRRATIKLNILAQINDKYPTHSFFSVVSPARDESSCTHAFQAHSTSDHKILSAWAALSPVAALPPQTEDFGEALLGFSKGTGSADTAGSSRGWGAAHTRNTASEPTWHSQLLHNAQEKKWGKMIWTYLHASPPVSG